MYNCSCKRASRRMGDGRRREEWMVHRKNEYEIVREGTKEGKKQS